jgi:hypothetical protein
MMEMIQPKIDAESRAISEAMIVEVNQSVEKLVSDLLATLIVENILANNDKIPGSYIFPNPFANPRLMKMFGNTVMEASKD